MNIGSSPSSPGPRPAFRFTRRAPSPETQAPAGKPEAAPATDADCHVTMAGSLKPPALDSAPPRTLHPTPDQAPPPPGELAPGPAPQQPPEEPAGPPAPPPQAESPKDSLFDLALMKILGISMWSTQPLLNDEQKQQIRAAVQPGDILLEGTATSVGWQIGERLFNTGKWTHAAVYVGDGHFIDSGSGDFVKENNLEDMLGEATHVAVFRPRFQTPEDKEFFLGYVRDAVGRPYDGAFDTVDETRLYCSELPYWGLKKMPHSIEVPVDRFAGRSMVAPDVFSHSPEIDPVYLSGGEGFAKDMLSHWPVAAVSVAGIAAGAHFGGVTGAVIGGVLATVGAVVIGNHIPPRH